MISELYRLFAGAQLYEDCAAKEAGPWKIALICCRSFGMGSERDNALHEMKDASPS